MHLKIGAADTVLNVSRCDHSCRLVGVAVTASQADIKAAYRKAALKLHPDVNNAANATQQFAQLTSAYGQRPGRPFC